MLHYRTSRPIGMTVTKVRANRCGYEDCMDAVKRIHPNTDVIQNARRAAPQTSRHPSSNFLALVGLSLAVLGAGRSAFAQPPDGNAGVCIELNQTGHVIEAQIVDSSGDRKTDLAILTQSLLTHWDKPYPPAGWVGIRFGIGPHGDTKKPRPTCDKFKYGSPM
jgi:hypothetical protein